MVPPKSEPLIRLCHNHQSNVTITIPLTTFTGVAAFGNAQSAVLPAILLITIIGILSGFGFALIGKVCAYTGATSCE